MKLNQANNLPELEVSTIDKSPFKKGEFKKLQKLFNKTIYFSPRTRYNQKLFFLEKKKTLETIWPLKDNPIYYSDEERKNIIDWANLTSKFLACIEMGEQFTTERKITHKKFYLFQESENLGREPGDEAIKITPPKAGHKAEEKPRALAHGSLYSHTKKPAVLLECHFYKVIEDEFKTVHLLIPKGIPRIGEVFRGRLIRMEVSKKGWMLLDEGIFNQKFITFYELLYSFRGKRLKFTLHAQASEKSIDSFLLSLA